MKPQKKDNTHTNKITKQATSSPASHNAQVNQTHEQAAKELNDTTSPPEIEETAKQSSVSKPNSKLEPVPPSLTYFVFTVVLIVILGIVLNSINLLPPQISTIATGLTVLIGIVIALWQAGGKDLLIRLGQSFWFRRPMWFSLGTAALFVAVVLLYDFYPRPSYSYPVVPSSYTPPAASPTITPLPLSPTPNVAWKQLLTQEAPDCNNTQVTWYEFLGKSFLSCSDGHHLAMQYQSSQDEPEVYLETVGGKVYDQKNFRLDVQISFTPKSNPSISAQVVVQADQPSSDSGGYFFILRPTGDWMLCKGSCRDYFDQIAGGRVYVDITHSVDMVIEVYHGELFGLINNNEVVHIADNSSSSARYVGLRAGTDLIGGEAGSSTILFSNFKLYASSSTS